MGITPILSDYYSFPIDPDLNTVDNCLSVVDERADLFLLIVGGRYGSTNNEGKSVTNLEYLRAKAKGIPIYAFVQKNIISILPVWKANSEANFHSVVDSSKLFDFVAFLMDSSGVWVFPFETAQDITDTLRKQLAFLFMDCLQLRKRVKASVLTEALSKLQGTPLKLVIERPFAWEHRLFIHVLSQEIYRIKKLRLDWNYKIASKKGKYLDGGAEVLSWIRRKIDEVQQLTKAVDQINVAFGDAVGPPGASGDPESIVYVAEKLAEVYRGAIEWAIEFQHVDVDEDFQSLIDTSSMFTRAMIREIEEFSEETLKELEEAILDPAVQNGQREVVFTPTLTPLDTKEFEREINRQSQLLYNRSQ